MSNSQVEPRAAVPRKGIQDWRYMPHVIVFFSAACIMVIELVAGRLIARHLGSSLYTWTSIIGVVLAGMSVGNYLGGRMADRWQPERFVGWLFLAASVTCLSTLFINQLLIDSAPFESLRWPTKVFSSVLVIFVLPSLVLGTISPAMAKIALSRSDAVGTTIGSVYAWATVGSIVGTLATGFFLIATLGAQGVVLVIALGLALVGVFLGPHRWLHVIWTVLVLTALLVAKSPNASAYEYGHKIGLREVHYLFDADSDYQYIKVYEDESEKDPKRTLRILALDYLIHGYVDLKDPTYLEYGYERIYQEVARRFIGKKERIATFFIGGGSYTFPRWVLHEWPGSQIDVAEIDPMVLEANHSALGLPRDTPIKTYLLDARNALDDLPSQQRYDVIFGDAFSDLSVPWHLTTLEFNYKIAAHLKPDGAYLINVIDDFEHGLFLGAVVATLQRAFCNVYVFSTEKDGVTPGRETFVVAATQRAIPTRDWRPGHGGSFHGSLLTEEHMKTLHRRSGGRVLTDDNAPVSNLLAPVVSARK